MFEFVEGVKVVAEMGGAAVFVAWMMAGFPTAKGGAF